MKTFLIVLAAVTGGLALLLAQQRRNGLTVPAGDAAAVDTLAHKLQDAWADHHTVA